jgi:PAS domain S-box-containing protein
MSGETIFIVEDEGIIAEYLRRILHNFGYKVPDPVSRGEIAVTKALEIQPDLVLIDIMLAGKMNGIEAASLIREKLDIPIIYLSAYAEDALLRQAQMTDPYGYLVKPVQDRELRAAVEVAFHKHAVNKKLKESENKFRQVVESASEVFWLRSKETGKMIYISPSYEKVFYQSCDEVYANPQAFLNKIHPEDREVVVQGHLRLSQEGIDFNQEYRIVLEDGNIRWIWARSAGVRNERGDVYRYAGAAEDITERKQAEFGRETLLHISQLFIQNLPLEAIYQQLCETLTSKFAFPVSAVQLFNRAEMVMEFSGAVGYPTPFDYRLPVDQSVSGTVALSGKSIVETDAQSRQDYQANLLRGMNLKSLIAVTFSYRGEVMGVITLADTKLRSGLEDIRGTLQIVANHLSQELARRQAEEELRTMYAETQLQYRRLALLHEIDAIITKGDDNTNKMIRSILDNIHDYLEVEYVALWSLGHEDRLLEISAVSGIPPHLPHSDKQPGWDEIYALRVYNDLQPLFASGARIDLADNPEIIHPHPTHLPFAMLPLVAKNQTKGVLGLFYKASVPFQEKDRIFLQSLATQMAIAIDNAQMHSRVKLSDMEVSAAYEATLQSWAQTLELRDKETNGHSVRVVDLTLRLAQEMGVTGEQLIHLRRGALLHDIGKLVIPDNVLKKPGKLDDAEWKIMRQHPVYAYQMLAGIPFLEPALALPLHHHEWWDGSGYPDGLKGEEIPFGARLFSVIDVWDALLEDRPYRPKFTTDQAREILLAQSGRQFDPDIVEIFCTRVIPQVTL